MVVKRLTDARAVSLAVVFGILAIGCSRFGGTRAKLTVTSEPVGAWVYLVPIELDPEEVDLREFSQSRRTPAVRMAVLPGAYWLVVEKSETRSRPREIDVVLGGTNEEHIDFHVND